MRHAHVVNPQHSLVTHPSPSYTRVHIPQQPKQTSQDVIVPQCSAELDGRVLQPPAKIATPASGSDVAARLYRALLRAAVLHVPAVTLKMSTTLEVPLPSAQGMRHAHVVEQKHRPFTHPSPSHTHPSCNNPNKLHKTYHCLRRRSRLRHPAATWLQGCIEPG